MSDFPVISLMMILPLLGALFILTINGEREAVYRNARQVALYSSMFTLALALFLVGRFNTANSGFQFEEIGEWLPEWGISYYFGVDGISLFFVLLSSFLVPVCIVASWNEVTFRVKEFMAAFMVLETMMIGAFCTLDSFLFFVFFEGGMIPMFLIIGIWGGERRVYSAFKFFLYTLAGSVFMLLAMLTLYSVTGTSSIPDLMHSSLPFHLQIWLFLAFFASFAVKIPMWPFHTWLPDAHVEAPTAGSVILAAVLLKMGGYGFLRFALPVFPLASEYFMPLMLWLGVIAIIYASVVALVQEDIKKLIAYSSVAQMGFVTIGIFSATVQGVEGAVFQMLSHGLISAALFLSVGVLYDRFHSRDIKRFGGLVSRMPVFATLIMIIMLGSAALPGTSGFIGEFLTLLGAFQRNIYVAGFAVTGVILGAAYILVLYRRVFFGPVTNPVLAKITDLEASEKALLVILALLVLWLGVFPAVVMDKISPSVKVLVDRYQTSVALAGDRSR